MSYRIGDDNIRLGCTFDRVKVAALESLYAQAFVPDEEIAYLQVGVRGELAAASFPSQRIDVVVDRIDPIAEVVDRRNVFRVRLRLLERQPWMRPGMEGVSKLDVGKRTYGWLFLHPLIDWVRMALWF